MKYPRCSPATYDAIRTSGALLLFITLFLLVSANLGEEIHVSPCLLKCKDAHMLALSQDRDEVTTMENEWSTEFAFPLLSLLKATGNETAAYYRANVICRNNEMLSSCLDRCNGSAERTIIKMGLMPWRDICNNLNDLREQFPCWRANIHNLTACCNAQSAEVRNTFAWLSKNFSFSLLHTVCMNLDRLSACLIKEFGRYCGAVSERFVQRMFVMSRDAMNGMLKMKFAVLPSSCSVGPLRRDIYSSELFSLNIASPISPLLSLILLVIVYF